MKTVKDNKPFQAEKFKKNNFRIVFDSEYNFLISDISKAISEYDPSIKNVVVSKLNYSQ
jgi:hypothetical protein